MNDNVQFFYNEGLLSGVTKPNPYNRYSEVLCHHAFECGYVDAHGRSSSLPI